MGSRSEDVSAMDPARPAPVQARLGERICPFLGLAGDPDTAAAYARHDHRCGLPGEGNPELSWQNHYCLVAEHAECPRFLRAPEAAETALARSPVPIVASAKGGRRRRWMLVGLALSAMIAVAVVAAAAHIGPWSGDQMNRAANGAHSASVGPRASIGGGGTGNHSSGRQPSGAGAVRSLATPAVSTPSATPRPVPKVADTPSTPLPTVTATPEPTPTQAPQPTPVVTPVAATPTPKPKPKPTPAPAKPKQPAIAIYTVKSGDTLTFIAQRFHTTVDAIAQLNKIPDPNVIATGQVLKLPPSPAPAQSP